MSESATETMSGSAEGATPATTNERASETEDDDPGIDWWTISLALSAFAFASGLFLAPPYDPSPELAATSLYDLREASPWSYLAKLHPVLGHLALLASSLYVLQSAVRGIYRTHSRRLWFLALLLLLVLTASAVSGRLLIWDRLALLVATASGLGTGASKLVWTFHSLLLPLFVLIVFATAWRIRCREKEAP